MGILGTAVIEFALRAAYVVYDTANIDIHALNVGVPYFVTVDASGITPIPITPSPWLPGLNQQ